MGCQSISYINDHFTASYGPCPSRAEQAVASGLSVLLQDTYARFCVTYTLNFEMHKYMLDDYLSATMPALIAVTSIR